MKKLHIFFLALALAVVSNAQKVNYSPAYFGPNALPVPPLGNATIPEKTTFSLSCNHYFGFGDVTTSLAPEIEIPLLPKRVSFKVLYTGPETYKVTQDVYDFRNMMGDRLQGSAWGEFYVQTRISLLMERKYAPAIILNSTLKTAAGTNFEQRRHFDTPGYYFDLEFGKSYHLGNKILSEIRTVTNIGFLCWETTNSTQNDAPMYGGKIILSNPYLDFENTLSGYWGWMRNGDNPLVYSSKIVYKRNLANYFLMYQYGIKDFPYHHIRVGFSIEFQKLTPNYCKLITQ
ncbi:MAG: hypothetical protein LBP96_05965 [Bacteroidales bacterium]|jgi:hypothetical protein|nr:hypothetical protein [Bacteroidales bacterium]